MGNKPTIFFSHSSKDKDVLLKFRNRLADITNGTLDIFMSSDGESIPFGTNWVHKIEQGLNDAKIMFIFITQNSLLSNWIYFESGFTYAKGIEVIPVGLGVDIGILKPPLNLLQGFNLNSGESLNNFITIINQKFDYKFKNNFTNKDFALLVDNETKFSLQTDLSKLFKSINYEILSKYSNAEYDIDKLFFDIKNYLDSNSMPYSYDENYGDWSRKNKCLLVQGIKIVYIIESSKTQDNKPDKLKFSISPYNFNQSFDLFNKFMQFLVEKNWIWLHMKLLDDFSYVTEVEKISSMLSNYPDVFCHSKNDIGGFEFIPKGFKFFVFDDNQWKQIKEKDFALGISYDPAKATAEDMFEFIYTLLEQNIIYES
ncbi:MAG: hypothetical protein BWY15_01606 [Firmicutes bacterium ADurb.Bin193]|nr:MAG: hypothetical protein BWY15_01606 [Firmicutes bacterium ADurb.Bin193]